MSRMRCARRSAAGPAAPGSGPRSALA
jgi:hypothetical protein